MRCTEEADEDPTNFREYVEALLAERDQVSVEDEKSKRSGKTPGRKGKGRK